ncbi:MAG: TonB-dependent receptor [Pyrinomonadaceae bacterium]|nr:TonB-dependent receptor [Pyrinomonadaceae bacterium]
MRKFTKILTLGLMLLLAQAAIQAQLTTGSISGTVTDASGAVVPGASVTVKGQAGQNYSATTNGEGYFTIPGVAAGTPTYTVTITAPNFKTAVVQNVKVDVGTPATVNTTLQAGQISEQVVVTSGAEVLQTETANVGTTIQGRQILETPIQSRDALDLVTMLPGTNTVGAVRTSSINGLPKSALTIQIDGVDVQDSYLKSSDGFFTFVRPRIDAIDEVTVSTSNPGSESAGDGAVQIRFATRRGTNDYKGSGFWQHRDESLFANNFLNNASGAPKGKLRLNQFGGSFGGPLAFLGFGEGVPAFDSGKDKRFFFVNYERFHLNESSVLRTRQVLTQEGQTGIFRYGSTGQFTANLFALPNNGTFDCDPNTPGNQVCPTTVDPTVNAMFNLIRATTSGTGTFTPVSGIGHRQNFNFYNPALSRRQFLAVRVDFNLTKNHSLENVFNYQPFRSNVDLLNGVDPAFPGLTNSGSQDSDRYSNSTALRSSFGQNKVNEFRFSKLFGNSYFILKGGREFFDNTQGGFTFGLGAGLTGPTIRNAYSRRSSPIHDFTDSFTWITGNHTFNFGGQFKRIETNSDDIARVVPTVSFGINATLDPANALFNSANQPVNFPGATTTDLANAAGLYATLTGRISGYANTGYLGGDGKYVASGPRYFKIRENTMGVFAQDTWRIRPNLTLSLGVRWQPQTGAELMTANYSRLTNFNMLYDVSGPGNIFKPGTLTGTVPTVTGNSIGEKAFANDLNNFAPSVGVVWSPEFGAGVWQKIFGRSGSSVFRGGFSRAFIREGTFLVEGSLPLNPGGNISLSRATNLTGSLQLTVGTLLRTPGNPNLSVPTFNDTPVYPRTLTTADSAVAFDPKLTSGYVDSFSFGYQRQFGRDTVVEFRYVGNRGKNMASLVSQNEVNAIENGFGAEFALAQQNLLTNIANGFGANFRYRGVGTGTFQLPIIMSYLAGNNADPSNTASYAGTLFANATFLGQLSAANPQIQGMINTLDSNFGATARTPGAFVPGGRPANFVHNCPTTLGFCFLMENSEKSWYDSAQVEFRRRLSAGIRVQGSYVWAKAFTNAYALASSLSGNNGVSDQRNISTATLRNRSLDRTYAQVDLRHAFKVDATFDLPFGKGRKFMSSSNWGSNAFFGGWTIAPVVRWQSGSPVGITDFQIVGMSGKDLQKAVKVYYNQTINGVVIPVSFLPQDIIENTIRAFSTVGTTVSGYTSAATTPTGRFLAPAGYGNCQQRSAGQCGFRKFVLYGPSFFKFDASVLKKIAIGEKRSIEMRVTAFDVLNRTNWRIGGWTGNVNQLGLGGTTFGQLLTGTSYQDPNGSNDPGGRLVDFLLRINF